MLRPHPHRTARPECMFFEAALKVRTEFRHVPNYIGSRNWHFLSRQKWRAGREEGGRKPTSAGAGGLLIKKPRGEFGEAAGGDGFADAAHEVEIEADVVLRI